MYRFEVHATVVYGGKMIQRLAVCFRTLPGLFNWIDDNASALGNLEKTVKKNGASAVSLMTIIAIIVLVCSTTIIGVKIMSSKATKRDDAKSHLTDVIIGGILLFSIGSIIYLFSKTFG